MFWQTTTYVPLLNEHEVHVWRTSLDVPDEQVEALGRLLSSDERAKAERFYFERDYRHYVVARGVLRQLLGRYLKRDPKALRFGYGQYGKPELLREEGQDAIHFTYQGGASAAPTLTTCNEDACKVGAALAPPSFNVSHSHEMALYAITRSIAVGVDVEYMKPNIEWKELAERFFSPLEVDMLLALPEDLQREGFFCCWTRKEAYVKARGLGLSLDLKLFDVSVNPLEPAVLLWTREDGQDRDEWTMYNVAPQPGYAGTVAVAASDVALQCFDWPGR